MNKVIANSLGFLFVIISFDGLAQGCSDAGVCSVGSLTLVTQFKYESLPYSSTKLEQVAVSDPGLEPDGKTNDSLPVFKSHTEMDGPTAKDSAGSNKSIERNAFPLFIFNFSGSYGIGDRSTSVYTTQIDANVRMGRKTYAQVKIPYSYIDGDLAKVHGLNDITLSLSYLAFLGKKSGLSLTGGVKLPTGNSNVRENGEPLPMIYQTSLGSFDAVAGLKLTLKKWDFTVGYQHSFNKNKNEYLHVAANDSSEYNDYFESKFLKRSDDVVFRFNRNFTHKKVGVNAGVLFIYHTAEDTYQNIHGERVIARDSKGLTVNLNLAGTISFSKKLDLIVVLANPVVVRKNRPDGLTRSFIGIVGLKYSIY